MTCDRKIGVYPCCSVVEGDCLELMKRPFPCGIVTTIADPPYGMKKAAWDMEIVAVDDWLPTACRIGPVLVFTGVKGAYDYPKPDWIIAWARSASTQRNGALKGFNNWEPILCYGLRSLDNDLFSIPNIPDGDSEGHPTPKPLRLMEHVVERIVPWNGTVFDPFCGSGTTLVAAKKLGRHFLGFEISPEYCEIARKRLAEIDAQPSLFEPKPEQLTLEERP